MKKSLIELIEQENRHKPYTDSDLADLLKTTRETVNDLRTQLKIPNSRERLNNVIYADSIEILSKEPDLSHRELMRRLNAMGYMISRSKALDLSNKIKAQKEKSIIGEIDKDELIVQKADDDKKSLDETHDPFSVVIGAEDSMKLQIRQAQAAVLYPPKGLHTLLLGPSGVGKSLLAELMYKYAVLTGNFTKDAPFIVFNCADYADNPQLLLSQLFGYVKGAFTGAEKDRKGLVEKANGGILFLDEIHRLPNEGQEILFNILDKGMFRRLGDSETNVQVSLMIIAATTEKSESSLLLTFRRRIPMVIELPPLSKRSHKERFSIIETFFNDEAKRIKKNIIVDTDALRALMLYNCPGNIGQLRSDIQVGCARALLNTVLQKSDIINIKLSDLANHVRVAMLDIDRKDIDVEKIIENKLVINVLGNAYNLDETNRYIMPNKIYQFIENRSNDLENQGLNSSEINLVISREIETELGYFAANISSKQQINKTELKNLVGNSVIEIVDECHQIGKRHFKDLKDSFYYSLAIHLSATYDRLLKGKTIINPELRKIKEKYSEEYKIASIMADKINDKLLIQMPEEEIGFIAMYIKNFSNNLNEGKKVNVVVLTHGEVGKSIVDVVNKLLNTNHAIGIEMSLEENPRDALERTIEVIKKTDQGKGTVLLVDMGSLTAFGDVITKRTGIEVKVLDRVDTLMALEVTRRAIIPESNLDEISKAMRSDSKKYSNDFKLEEEKKYRHDSKLPKAIVTICITGEGSADKIKEYIEKVVEKLQADIIVIPVGVISPVNIDLRIKRIMNNYNVIAFVGTIDPEVSDVPFISMQNLFDYEGIKGLNMIIKNNETNNDSLGELIDPDLIYFEKGFDTKDKAIDFIVKKAEEKGYVDEKFLLSVYKREAITPTYVKGGIAIPHGFPQYVTKPVIAILRMEQEVSWMGDEGNVKIVFLIAYKKNSKKYFQDIYKILLNQEVLKKLKEAKDKNEIVELIKQHATV
jgi:transcriptional regulator with AAA-type ATPase domain/transcriptional regulatory protein LevR/mannitol/fructose-specific phosphotransferase system IIA component (Ntr-type)